MLPNHLERVEVRYIMSKLITDEIILDAINKGLSALGETPQKALWYCLEKDFKFDRNKIPEDFEAFEAFEKTLKGFFGLGYTFLESLFRQELQKATGEDLKDYKTFADCIQGLRKKAENVKK